MQIAAKAIIKRVESLRRVARPGSRGAGLNVSVGHELKTRLEHNTSAYPDEQTLAPTIGFVSYGPTPEVSIVETG